MAGKQVAKKGETAVADFNPAIFEADAQVGLKNLDQEDMALPFLKIVSGLDPILDEREDVRKGDIVNTVTGEVYKGKDGIRVILAPTSVSLSSGALAALEAVRPHIYSTPATKCQRLSGTPMTIKNILLTGPAIIWSRPRSGM